MAAAPPWPPARQKRRPGGAAQDRDRDREVVVLEQQLDLDRTAPPGLGDLLWIDRPHAESTADPVCLSEESQRVGCFLAVRMKGYVDDAPGTEVSGRP